ncbi:retrovirus-related pol polyprotein from transposon TNT 1-94 [Tanacetum coccineum]
MAELQCNKFRGGEDKVMLEKEMLAKAKEARQILDEEQLAFVADLGIQDDEAIQTTIPNTVAFQTEDLDAYYSACDDVSNAKAVLIANLSSYVSDVLSEYLQETQLVAVQDTNLYAQQDSMILSVIEQMSKQMISYVNNWEKANQEKNNESVTAELKRYKERVKTFEQRLNVDLSICEKMIDSQMEDMIKEKLALNAHVNKATSFYVNAHKEALGYQNPFYLKKAQWIKPTLYDGILIFDKHVAMPVIDDEETLILEELNRLSEDFGKHFVRQQELTNEQAFWLQTSHPNTDQSVSSPVKIEAPRELPKDEIIPFLKNLKDIFNVFDKNLLNEVTEEQTVFTQMEAVVQLYFVDKKCFEIQKQEFFLENDRLLQKIMSQDVMICVINSISIFNDVNVEMQSSESYVKCVDLDAELLNKQSAYNDLSKSYSPLEKHCISLELTMQLNQEIFQKDSLSMFKLDLDPLAPRLLQNREAHTYYLKHTQEQADILRGIVEQAKAKQPLDNTLDLASRDTNLYTNSLDDMLKTSSIFLLSKASKTKSWLWHRRLSHLNFGKSKKSSHQTKAEDTNQEKLYLLQMDLCGPMRVESIIGKKYILVIVDDSRFTWVRFLRSKDEAPNAIIKCIKNIQVHFNAIVCNVRTYNGTKLVNQTLRDFYENVNISHQTSVARTPQQNDIVERQN